MKFKILVVAGLLAIAMTIFWSESEPTSATNPTQSSHSKPISEQSSSHAAAINHSTSVNGQHSQQAHSSNNSELISEYELSEHTLALFDSVIAQSDVKDPALLVEQLVEQLRLAGYADSVIEWLSELFSRYIDYKSQLGAVKTATTDRLFSADHMQDTLDSLSRLRTDYFTDDEITALFGTQDEYDQMALARLRIQQDDDLSAAQKQQLLEENIAQLPEQVRESLAPSLDIRKLQVIKSESETLTREQRFARLSAEYGDEAAQRISDALDEKTSWNNRVKEFQSTLDALRSDESLTEQQIKERIAELKSTSFSDNEKRRLDVFLRNPQLLSN